MDIRKKIEAGFYTKERKPVDYVKRLSAITEAFKYNLIDKAAAMKAKDELELDLKSYNERPNFDKDVLFELGLTKHPKGELLLEMACARVGVGACGRERLLAILDEATDLAVLLKPDNHPF